MARLKLAKLPLRTPVRITVTLAPELYRMLEAYGEVYRETYGETEKVGELIPFMLESFMAADKDFAKARKAGPTSKQPG